MNAHARIESNQFGAQLGTVAGAGDVNGDGFDDIIVGAHNYEGLFQGQPLEVNGAAFVYYGSAAGITGTDPTNADAVIRANELGSNLGAFVAGAGDVNGDGFADIIVGVPGHGTPFPPNIPPNQRSGDHGAALIFHGSAIGITGTGFDDANAVLLSYTDTGQPQPPIHGAIGSVSGAADVNNDGFDDVVLGGSEIALFFGGPSGVGNRNLTQADSRIQVGGPIGFEPFTFRATAAGDVNDDGHADIIAGSPFRELVPFTARQEGTAWVFLGGPTGLTATDTTQADTTLEGSLLAEWVGASVAGAGDIDGDGFDDVLVAARVYPGSLDSEGVAYLFRGSAAGITATSLLEADVRLQTMQSGAVVLGNNAAFSVSGAGDVNGDGFDDVIMGAGYYDAGEENEGAAFIYLGGPWSANPNQPPVANAGADQAILDTNADGVEPVTVDGSASFDPDGIIVSYAWFEGETLLGEEAVLSTTLTTTGDHTLILTVTDDNGVTRGDPVLVRVDQVDDVFVLSDNFTSGFGAWTTGGDVLLSSTDPFPDAPQTRLGAAGAFLRRAIDLPTGSTGITLDFWAKASQFASTDELLVKVSVDGGPFATIKTFTSADSTNAYLFYGGSAFPLGHSWFPATASNIVLEFESRMTTGLFFVDDIRVTALLAPTGGTQNQMPVASAGTDQTASDLDGNGAEIVTLNGSGSSDLDGTIVSHTWREGNILLGNSATLQIAFDIGIHTVTLTVTDNAGATSSDTTIVTVNAGVPSSPPQGEVAISGPTSVGRGDRVSFTVTLSNTGSTTLTGVQLTFSVSPNRRLKDVSPGSSVSIGSVPPGDSVSQIWSGRADREGAATVTAETFSGSSSLDTATQPLTVVK